MHTLKEIKHFFGILVVIIFFAPLSHFLAAEDGRKLAHTVGFPVDTLRQDLKEKGWEHLQVAADQCLDLKSASINDNQISLLLAVNNKWPKMGEDMIWCFPLLVRYFDKNGQYLGHFTTREQFIPDWGREVFFERAGSYIDAKQIQVLTLLEEGSQLSYAINARDADYISIVEVSMADISDKVVPNRGVQYFMEKNYFLESNSKYAEEFRKKGAAQKAAEDLTVDVRIIDENPSRMSLIYGDKTTIELVLIPQGSFRMGSPKREENREDNEKQRDVTLSKSFYIGAYPITQRQYEKAIGRNPSKFKDFDNSAEHPVERVLWQDAVDFCRKLSERSGRVVRLPTEAEWEYACRAGTKTAYYFDEKISPSGNLFNFSSKSTTPVGKYLPNQWGLYDMHGNVMEWCLDGFGEYSDGDAIDPQGPEDAPTRVIRGGSWEDQARYCRSAFRGWCDPRDAENSGMFSFSANYTDRWNSPGRGRHANIGFRILIETTQDEEAIAATLASQEIPESSPSELESTSDLESIEHSNNPTQKISSAIDISNPKEDDSGKQMWQGRTIVFPNDIGDLYRAIAEANDDDTILIRPGRHSLKRYLKIDKNIRILGDPQNQDSVVLEITENDSQMALFVAGGSPVISGITLSLPHGATNGECVRIKDGASPTLDNCTILSPRNDGVAILAGANPTIDRTLIINSGRFGVIAYGNGTLTNCDISGSVLANVHIQKGGDPQLTNCRIFKGEQGGIFVHDGGKGSFAQCEIFENTYAGIEIADGGNPSVMGCRFYDGQQSGIYVHSNGTGKFVNCKIFQNMLAGITVVKGGNPTVLDTEIYEGRYTGVCIHENGEGVFNNCKIFENSKSGIHVSERSNPKVERCTIEDNGGPGIQINEQGAGVFRQNSITGNKEGEWSINGASSNLIREENTPNQ
jgi:Uncharacterized conserved protein